MSLEYDRVEICGTCTLRDNDKALLARDWALAPYELTGDQASKFGALSLNDKDQALQCRSQILRKICTSIVIKPK